MVRDGHIMLIDVAFAELRPTPWRQAVDLANMMLCLALRSSANRSTGGRCSSSRSRRSPKLSPPPAAWRSRHSCAERCAPRDVTSTASSSACSRAPRPSRSSAGRSSVSSSPSARRPSSPCCVQLGAAVRHRRQHPHPGERGGDCDGELEPLWLQAQAVATAEFVPCVNPLPVGWSFRPTDGQQRAVDDHRRSRPSRRQGDRRRFTESCDVSGTTEVATDVPGARRFESGPDDERLHPHVVRGVPRWLHEVRLSSDNDAPSGRRGVRQAGLVIGFVSRADLEQGSTSVRTDA